MSFRCGVCDDPQPVKTKPERIVLEYRSKVYHLRDDKVSNGFEIVREENACKDCAEHHRHMLEVAG